jgi:hypothetical protein
MSLLCNFNLARKMKDQALMLPVYFERYHKHPERLPFQGKQHPERG